MKQWTRKGLGSLALAAVLAVTAVHPAMAGENGAGTAAQNEMETGNIRDSVKDVPSIMADEVTWDGGRMEIPVDFGDYPADGVNVCLEERRDDGLASWTSLMRVEGGNAVYAPRNIADMRGDEWFAKAGDYKRFVVFSTGGEEISEYELTVHIPEDSMKWQVEKTTLEFDGSRDIVFQFVNGTNYFELETVTYLNLFTGMGGEGDPVVIVPDMTEGFSCDMEKGTLTIDKDALKRTLASAESYNGGTLPDEIAVNVRAVTTHGDELWFNRVPLEGMTGDITAWWLDISGLELEEEPEPSPEEPEAVFSGAEGAAVSEEDAAVIAADALGFVQKNYAEELSRINGNYTVSARLSAAGQKEEYVQEKVKNAFVAAAKDAEIGKYYEIGVFADVAVDGKPVEGLTGIRIPRLSEEISVCIEVPETLRKEGRVFTVLHYSGERQVSALETVEKDGMVSFQTAAFSPYALAYKDPEKETEENADRPPKTGDAASVPQTVALGMSVMAILGIVLYGRKKYIK